jgi:hypothetical protein
MQPIILQHDVYFLCSTSFIIKLVHPHLTLIFAAVLLFYYFFLIIVSSTVDYSYRFLDQHGLGYRTGGLGLEEGQR